MAVLNNSAEITAPINKMTISHSTGEISKKIEAEKTQTATIRSIFRLRSFFKPWRQPLMA
jgi:hypothetical protein